MFWLQVKNAVCFPGRNGSKEIRRRNPLHWLRVIRDDRLSPIWKPLSLLPSLIYGGYISRTYEFNHSERLMDMQCRFDCNYLSRVCAVAQVAKVCLVAEGVTFQLSVRQHSVPISVDLFTTFSEDEADKPPERLSYATARGGRNRQQRFQNLNFEARTMRILPFLFLHP